MLKYDTDNENTYNKQNWAFQINIRLNNLGLTIKIIEQIKQRIIDNYIHTWYTSLNLSQRLISYRRFKTEICLESYIDNISNALIKFRLSSVTTNSALGE